VDIPSFINEMLLDPEVTDLQLCVGESPWVRGSRDLVKIDHPIITVFELENWLQVVWPAYRKAPPQEGTDFSVSLPCGRLRVNLYQASGRLNLAIRRFVTGEVVFSALGLPERVLALADRPRGLFLVTGPTGSGKSTTLAALTHHINTLRCGHIITIEDPIEYTHPSRQCRVTQREIGTDVPDFACGLRAALRQDPDVILVGELRDRKTTEMALRAAETGHLVLTTTHTNGAWQTLERLAGFFDGADRTAALGTLASVLNGIISQALLRDSQGRIVIAPEIMVPTAAIRHNIREGNTIAIRQAMETGAGDGQLLLDRALAQLVQARRIKREDALYHAADPIRLGRML
jgi:twitching motility protein PilT